MSAAVFDLSILGPALIAGLLVLATHVPLGREVLARGIIFIDLAVAQVAGLGVLAAHYFGDEPGALAVQAAAVTAALAAAVVLNYTEKRWAEIQEALIGALFILAASGGILLLAGSPRGGEHLRELLVGQILWVTPQALAITALVYPSCLRYGSACARGSRQPGSTCSSRSPSRPRYSSWASIWCSRA